MQAINRYIEKQYTRQHWMFWLLFFDLNLLANIVAKLGNIVGENVKFGMFANNVGQFGLSFRLSLVLDLFIICYQISGSCSYESFLIK